MLTTEEIPEGKKFQSQVFSGRPLPTNFSLPPSAEQAALRVWVSAEEHCHGLYLTYSAARANGPCSLFAQTCLIYDMGGQEEDTKHIYESKRG